MNAAAGTPPTIVVGVDGSEPLRNAPCDGRPTRRSSPAPSSTVVTTWEYPPTLGWAPPYPSDFDPNADARKALHDTVDAVLGADPGVVLQLTVTEGHPAFVLTEAAQGAELLVVGSRGHGAFAGMLLGSVSEYCASHARVSGGGGASPRGQAVARSCATSTGGASPRGARCALGRARSRRRPTRAPGDRAATETATLPLHDELYGLQDRLWAESRRSLLVVLQGLDASGKDGTIKHVFRGVNPQGITVASFKEPTTKSWPTTSCGVSTSACPRRGRSASSTAPTTKTSWWCGSTISCPKRCGGPATATSTPSSRHLVAAGTTVVKFFLHVSFEEQGKRLRSRLDEPDKRWKAQAGDFAERKLWDSYQAAYTDMLEKTSTETAPWFVIPADHKWYRNWVVSQVLLQHPRADGPAATPSPRRSTLPDDAV